MHPSNFSPDAQRHNFTSAQFRNLFPHRARMPANHQTTSKTTCLTITQKHWKSLKNNQNHRFRPILRSKKIEPYDCKRYPKKAFTHITTTFFYPMTKPQGTPQKNSNNYLVKTHQEKTGLDSSYQKTQGTLKKTLKTFRNSLKNTTPPPQKKKTKNVDLPWPETHWKPPNKHTHTKKLVSDVPRHTCCSKRLLLLCSSFSWLRKSVAWLRVASASGEQRLCLIFFLGGFSFSFFASNLFFCFVFIFWGVYGFLQTCFFGFCGFHCFLV